jgi:hypothetical protein
MPEEAFELSMLAGEPAQMPSEADVEVRESSPPTTAAAMARRRAPQRRQQKNVKSSFRAIVPSRPG